MAVSAGVTALAAASSDGARAADTAGLVVCMHGITSSEFDFRTCMEGWAKAGIRAAEPDLVKAREFEAANGAGSARRLMDDLGLVAYSSTNQLNLDERADARVQAVEDLKWKVAMAESLGATRLVIPSTANQPHVLADYEQLRADMYAYGEIAKPHNVALMVEFTRNSRLVNNLRTSLDLVRSVNHPNIRFMIDLYHFWAGPSKFEDLDLIEPGEIHHVHFADTPRSPALEVAEQKDRAFPGEGIAPLQKILNKLVEKGYNRALSLELFDMDVRRTDPAVIAGRALETITPFIRGVA
ncbi:MAG TPA: sugar phosphate isomerase/epimerase [Pseudomonadales bacterium]